MKNKYKKYYKRKLQQELNEASIAELVTKASGAVKSGLKAIRNRKRGTIRSHVLSAALLAPIAGPGTSTVVPGTPPSTREVMVDPGAPATPGKTIETQKRKVVTSWDPNAELEVTTQIAGPKTPSTETISGRDLTGKSVRVKLDRGELPLGRDAVVLGGQHAELALKRSAPGSVTHEKAKRVLANPITTDVGGDITSVTVPGSPARPPTFKTEFVPGTPATKKTTPGSLIPQHIEANLEGPTTVQQAPPPNRKRRRGSTQTPSGEGRVPSGEGRVPSGEGRVLRTGGNEDGSRRTGGVDPIPQDTPRPGSVRVPVVTPGRRGLGNPNRTVSVPVGSLAARRGRLTNIRENNELQSLNEAIQNILNKK